MLCSITPVGLGTSCGGLRGGVGSAPTPAEGGVVIGVLHGAHAHAIFGGALKLTGRTTLRLLYSVVRTPRVWGPWLDAAYINTVRARARSLGALGAGNLDRLVPFPCCGGAGYRPHPWVGDGEQPRPGLGPVDRLIATCALRHVPHELLRQVRLGGVLVVPLVREFWSGALMKLHVQDDGTATGPFCGGATYMPMRSHRTPDLHEIRGKGRARAAGLVGVRSCGAPRHRTVRATPGGRFVGPVGRNLLLDGEALARLLHRTLRLVHHHGDQLLPDERWVRSESPTWATPAAPGYAPRGRRREQGRRSLRPAPAHPAR